MLVWAEGYWGGGSNGRYWKGQEEFKKKSPQFIITVEPPPLSKVTSYNHINIS
jgi:hypothetical protein